MPEQTYKTVNVQTLINVKKSLESGLEYAKLALSEHDSDYGRSTVKNKTYAEIMELDIASIESVIAEISHHIPNQ